MLDALHRLELKPNWVAPRLEHVRLSAKAHPHAAFVRRRVAVHDSGLALLEAYAKRTPQFACWAIGLDASVARRPLALLVAYAKRTPQFAFWAIGLEASVARRPLALLVAYAKRTPQFASWAIGLEAPGAR